MGRPVLNPPWSLQRPLAMGGFWQGLPVVRACAPQTFGFMGFFMFFLRLPGQERRQQPPFPRPWRQCA